MTKEYRAEWHMHTEMSFLDGYATPQEYFERATELNIQAICATEHGNVISQVYYDKIKDRYPNIKMVYGCEFYECDDIHVQDVNNKYYHLLMLARNEQGRIAINKLVRLSRDGFYFKKRIDLNLCRQIDTSNVIVSSACLASKLNQYDYETCISLIQEYKSIFPYFYLEMQSSKHKEQLEYNKKILSLSKDTNTPFVITTDSHFAKKEDKEYQQMLSKIGNDKDTENEIYDYCYLQSVEEIHKNLDDNIGRDNVSLGMKNSLDILHLCDDVNCPWQEPTLPHYPYDTSVYNSEYECLVGLANQGMVKRGIDKFDDNKRKTYIDRLKYELGIIKDMGFVGYFLIVQDYIQWAKTHEVGVGIARGSGAGSLVNFALGITDLDPIKYDLIFERFLNPERVSLPKQYWAFYLNPIT